MEVNDCLKLISNSIVNQKFVKIILSKPSNKSSDLKNIYVRKIQLKSKDALSCTFRYSTNDQVKNYSISEGLKNIEKWIDREFHITTLITTTSEITFKRNKHGIHMIEKESSHILPSGESSRHNKSKKRFLDLDRSFLYHLGITDKEGRLIPSKADKYRQINKYLEIIDALVHDYSFGSAIQIVDMGSGKGYLTFALYDYLTNILKKEAMVFGIESREELVNFCYEKAEVCGFEQLYFQSSTIE